MPKPLPVNIPPDDVYLIIEALGHYLQSWEATEIVNRFGYMPDVHPVHVDCLDAALAHKQVLRVKGVLKRFHRSLDQVA